MDAHSLLLFATIQRTHHRHFNLLYPIVRTQVTLITLSR
jgi:hypothetical protein